MKYHFWAQRREQDSKMFIKTEEHNSNKEASASLELFLTDIYKIEGTTLLAFHGWVEDGWVGGGYVKLFEKGQQSYTTTDNLVFGYTKAKNGN